MKELYIDCETTGTNAFKNDVIQIAGYIFIDGKKKEEFNFKCQPFLYENIDEKALEITGLTVREIKYFEKPEVVYEKVLKIFDKYIDKYNKKDKFILCGYNVDFDKDFLNSFFKKNGNNYFFSYVGSVKDPFKVLIYLKSIGHYQGGSLKLSEICKYLGIEILNAHDAMEDIRATKYLIEKIDKLLKNVYIEKNESELFCICGSTVVEIETPKPFDSYLATCKKCKHLITKDDLEIMKG